MRETGFGRPPKGRAANNALCSNCEINPRPGYGNYCLACKALYMRLTRPMHADMLPSQRERANARAYANVYQRRGKLKSQPCEKCGTHLRIEKHHDDYSKPLEVRWICRECHLKEHANARLVRRLDTGKARAKSRD